MDIQDNEVNYRSQEVMTPDTGVQPPPPDLLEVADATPAALVTTKQEQKPPSTPLQDSLRRLRRDKRAMVSIIFLALFVLIPLVGPFIYQHIGAPYDSLLNGTISATEYHGYTYQELTDQDQLPSARHWLGTDALGRDLLARLMQGMLISLVVAILVEVVDIGLGLVVGVAAGYFGGWIDQFLARFTDLMFAFPGLLFVILLTGILGTTADTVLANIPVVGPNGNARLILVSLALAITVWPLMARFVRGQTLQLKEQQFIEAARTSGTSNLRIIMRHIIPNLFSLVFIASTLNLANTIIGEAGISFLGLGVQPPGSSIGLMISDATTLLDTHPWETIVPMTALILIVLAFTFLGDGLRDAFDPRSKD